MDDAEPIRALLNLPPIEGGDQWRSRTRPLVSGMREAKEDLSHRSSLGGERILLRARVELELLPGPVRTYGCEGASRASRWEASRASLRGTSPGFS